MTTPVRGPRERWEGAPPRFVLMLTVRDATVSHAHQVLDELGGLGLRDIGFKDVGLPVSELKGLAERIQSDFGAAAYLEVVSESADAELASIEAGLSLGVDYILGGTNVEAALPLLAGSGVEYFPFPGRVVGHPSVLAGTVSEIAESAGRLASLDGVTGLDLLAYRFDGDVPQLMQEVVASAGIPVLVAGSIDSTARIDAVGQAGGWGFTIGSAILTGALAIEADEMSPRGLVTAVLEHGAAREAPGL
jgi:hypothetical protein